MLKGKHFIHFLLVLVSVTITVVGCSKKTKYKLSGVIYNDCGEPVGKIKIDIRQRSTAFVDNSGGSLKTIETLADGTFEYKYKSLDNANTPIAIFDGTSSNATLLMSGIPANSDEIVTIYKQKSVNISFTLKFDTLPIPLGDTLYNKKDTIYIGGHQYAGTFHNGQVIGPIKETQDVNFYGWENKVYKLCWGVNKSAYYYSLYTLGKYNEYQVIKYKMTDCDTPLNISIPIK
jgi:hypothetical protein